MRCIDFRKRIHDFVDRQLDARTMSGMDVHRSNCHSCSELFDEITAIQKALSVRYSVPEYSAQRLLSRIHGRSSAGLGEKILGLWRALGTWWRDCDRSLLWSRAGAVPITLCFFVLIMLYTPPEKVEDFAFLIVSAQKEAAGEQLRAPLMINLRTQPNRDNFLGVVEAAWRLPYEDSLSLVAEITPEGRLEPGDVLEYPKSDALLNAVDHALRRSRFERGEHFTFRLVIFSFQKIDVYEQTGLPSANSL
jgi:hypothetical protein